MSNEPPSRIAQIKQGKPEYTQEPARQAQQDFTSRTFPPLERQNLGMFEPYPPPPPLASSLNSTWMGPRETARVDQRQNSDDTNSKPPSSGSHPVFQPPVQHSRPSGNIHGLPFEKFDPFRETTWAGGYAGIRTGVELVPKHYSQEPQRPVPYEVHRQSQLPSPPEKPSPTVKAEREGSPETEDAFGENSPDHSPHGPNPYHVPEGFGADSTSPYEAHIARFRDGAFHNAVKQVQPELSREQHDYAQKQVRALSSVGEQSGHTLDHVGHGSPDDCGCGCCGGRCSCHPLYCECPGCDHAEDAKQLAAEAQRKWRPHNAEDVHCGCQAGQRKCLCLPGLCACEVGDEDHPEQTRVQERQDSSLSGKRCQCPAESCGCIDCPAHIQRNDAERSHSTCTFKAKQSGQQSVSGQDRISDRDVLSTKDGTFAVQRNLIWGINSDSIRRFDEEVLRKRPDMTREERHEALLLFHLRERQMESVKEGKKTVNGQGRFGSFSATSPARMGEQPSPPLCSCSIGAPCAYHSGSDRCGKGNSGGSLLDIKGTYTSSRPSQAATPSWPHASQSVQQNQQLDIGTRSNASPSNRHGHLTLSELVGEHPSQERAWSSTAAAPGTPAVQRSISRPDTPRPPPESGTLMPYSYQVLQDYVRQSVEPEFPQPNWQRESTPAYVDRSATPSPLSRHEADVEMRDASGGLAQTTAERQASLPPSTLHLGRSRPHSPEKPPIPPIPGSGSPLKQPKRGDRRKSAIQGAKIDKRSVTASAVTKSNPSKAKSRTVTRKVTTARQPTASVRKLVGQPRKMDKAAAGTAAAGAAQKANAGNAGGAKLTDGGKVAAAAEKIEQQMCSQEEDNIKQKDGTPVRRSRRANKGVRTSLG